MEWKMEELEARPDYLCESPGQERRSVIWLCFNRDGSAIASL